MLKFLKGFFYVVILLFALIQFYPKSEKNKEIQLNPNDISLSNNPPADVQNILKMSCYDCHSNNTTYPWYASVQPVAWWLENHISQGKKDLNFSTFGNYTPRRKFKKLEQIMQLVKENEMPLQSYTFIHTKSKLDEAKKNRLLTWVNDAYIAMKENYPIDSLSPKK